MDEDLKARIEKQKQLKQQKQERFLKAILEMEDPIYIIILLMFESVSDSVQDKLIDLAEKITDEK